MAKTTRDKAAKAKVEARSGSAGSASAAAHKYVREGLDNTGLSTKAKTELYNKLKPIVESRIQNDLKKTATRGAIQVKREEINANKKAVNKIVGGK